MDRYVKNFIAVSIFYLAVASLLGVAMAMHPALGAYRFVHSHLMLIGWVTMMIYGVGYHILPRFAGKLIKNKGLAEAQFWAANAGLIGMVVFYGMSQRDASYKVAFGLFSAIQVISIFMFFYNMIATLYAKDEQH